MAGWRDSALCRQVDSELFFSNSPTDQRHAKRVCASCPVRAQCLEYALVALPHGVAGGLTASQRRKLRTSRQRDVVAAWVDQVVAA